MLPAQVRDQTKNGATDMLHPAAAFHLSRFFLFFLTVASQQIKLIPYLTDHVGKMDGQAFQPLL